MEFHDIESIALEVTSEGQKWLFTGVYKPPCILDNKFYTEFSLTTEKFVKNYHNFILMGDMNFNMLDNEKCSILKDSSNIFCLKNLVKTPTCFTKISKPTLLDVILTNQENKCSKICNFGCRLSDVHNLIAIQVKCERPNVKPKYKKCRSFKNFDVQNFLVDLEYQTWDTISEDHQNINVSTVYENFNNKFIQIANKHAPFKERKILPKQIPFMNKTLKSAVYKNK